MLKKLNKIGATGSGIAMIFVALICLNIISSKLYVRADVTEDSVFTLSEGTKSILGKVPSDFTVKYYFSRSHKSLPPMIKTYATRVEEMLREYVSYSDGNMSLEIHDPKPDTDEEEWARKYGINGARLPEGGELFFGAVMMVGSKEIPIPYFDSRREEFLEYDLTEAIVQTQETVKPVVGIMSSLAMMGGGAPQMPGMPPAPGSQEWVVVSGLKKSFTVKEIKPEVMVIEPDVKVLLVIHPKNLGDKTNYAIDQFIMRGGRLIVLVDPFSRTELAVAGQQARMSGRMPDVGSDFGKFFNAWGIGYDKQNIVGDLTQMMRVNAGGRLVAYPYFMTLQNDSIKKDSIVSGKLKQVLMAEAGSLKFDKKKNADLSFEVLLNTSADSGVANGMMAAYMGPQDFAKELKVDGDTHAVAGFLKGTFSSVFTAPPAYGEGEKGPEGHIAKGSSENIVMIVSDSDFISDGNSVDKMKFGPQVITRLRNDNLNLIFNAVDHLGGNEALIGIRSSGRVARPFTKVQEIQKNAQIRWKAEEEKLSAQLQDLQKKLQQLQGEKTDGNRLNLSANQQSEIERFRTEERGVRKKRREVRRNLREDIEALGNNLKLANLLVVPIFVMIFGFITFYRRSNRITRG